MTAVLLPRDFRRRSAVGGAFQTRHASGFYGDIDGDFLEDWKRVDVDVSAFGVGSAKLVANDALIKARIVVADVEEMKDGGEASDGVVFFVRCGVIVDGGVGDENVVLFPLESHGR